jgi:hypothetical protein
MRHGGDTSWWYMHKMTKRYRSIHRHINIPTDEKRALQTPTLRVAWCKTVELSTLQAVINRVDAGLEVKEER